MANIAYVRVSTQEQNTGRQFELFQQRGIHIDRYFEEKLSGKNMKRPELSAMMDYIREGDTVYIESISRLARNVHDFLELVAAMDAKGVGIVSLKENIIDTTTPQGKFVTTLFAALAELERETILERQREGIDLALKEGRPYGRPKYVYSSTFDYNYQRWARKEITRKQFLEYENIKRGSFHAVITRYRAMHPELAATAEPQQTKA